MFRPMFLIDLAEISATSRVTHFFNVQIVVAKRWGGVGWLVKYVGAVAVDGMATMEKRELYPVLGAFKKWKALCLTDVGKS